MFARPAPDIDPFERMRGLLSWDPFRDWPTRLLPTADEDEGFVPAFEVRETQDAYIFKADLPGVHENDLEINVTGDRLTVSGRREEEREEEREEGAYYFYERSYGSFSRSFTLPDDVDTERVEADLGEGVLSLTIPKKPASQVRRIAVRGAQTGEGETAKGQTAAEQAEGQPSHDGGVPAEQPSAEERPGAHA